MRRACFTIIGLGALLGACSDDQLDNTLVDGQFTQPEWERIQTLSPLPEIRPDTTNAVADDPDAAVLGQMLYFEKDISEELTVDSHLGTVGQTGRVSCASCHHPTWFDDQQSSPNATSVGTGWGPRNSPTVVNVVFYKWFYWEGRADSLWAQAAGAAQSSFQQAASRLRIAHVMHEQYRDEYNALFDPDLDDALDPAHPDAARFPATGGPKAAGEPDGPWEGMTAEDQEHVTRILVNFAKAIAAYERLLVSRNAPFDQYVAGETDAISVSAKRGLKLFVGKAGCVECHDTPIFTDQDFHNIAVPQVGEHVLEEDLGRFRAVEQLLGSSLNSNGAYSDDQNTGKLDDVEQTEALRGAFRTKHLRQIAMTGPYMHTGHLETLEDVIEHYDQGGADSGFVGTKDELLVPLNLTAEEKSDLVEFLRTLTGDEPPDELQRDTSK